MNRLRARDPAPRDEIVPTIAREPTSDETAQQKHSTTGVGPDAFPGNYRRYYIEMIEDIATWLKAAAPLRRLG
ncbi:MAG: hypothetical protein NTAFB05_21560 [Nitrobacter sp.]|uniref:hypothetical protein n=1 Tax=Nitrobacter sp. TaxID=29420 RepID=UPI00387DF45A